MNDHVEPKPIITTGTVATGGSLTVVGLLIANLNSIMPYVDKIGLAATIAIGCLVFGGVMIILVLQWIATHGAKTAESIRDNSTKQTMILSEMRTTQIDHGHMLKDHGDKIRDIHRAIECTPPKGQTT